MFGVDVCVLRRGVCIVVSPLEEDHKQKVAENEDQKHQLRNEFQQDVGELFLDQFVPKTQTKTKQHVQQSKDQGNLHFVTV